MSNRFNHIQPPNQFKYREGRTVLKQQYDFKCDNRIYFSEDIFRDLHNHSYRLYVDVLSPIGDYGLGLDFNEVDAIYNKMIEPKLNHQLINETLPDMNTTAENIAMWIWDEFEQHLPGEHCMYALQLFETDRHGVSLNRSIMKL
ncbi:6-pyruvoyl trahydropterin synthase family protein [Staphylococcus haemolyticus]|uniref:6-pyruvoyl trahydropterin synthase family protein n=1 Tax=Staphylococcus haemolyticus TaxID=1283 RepID=UPI001F0AEB31|nr:6-carboxytetrahydropterin synthase [Staphylococcus haemolyticus]MCH4534820.1 6-carboxytetrahydropterin synthase [Staphylococcus haemolyticus]